MAKKEYIERGAVISCILEVNHNLAGVIQHINEHVPTVDVVEVRHGKYIQASKTAQVGLKCSLCGARIKYSEHFNGNHHYCYKCGAKMDGERKEKK